MPSQEMEMSLGRLDRNGGRGQTHLPNPDSVLVDAVHAVLRVEESSIHSGVSSASGAVNEMCARGDEFISILDLDRVLDFNAN